MFAKTSKILSLIFILTICFVFDSFAQTKTQNDLGTEVQIRGGIGGKHNSCFPTDNLIVTKQEFEKLLNDKRCSLLNIVKVDFSKQTLINYTVGGDCHMRVTHKLFRNDKTKTYTIEVKNYWGRCRAGGSFHSWIVIDKIPTNYTVKLKEIQIDDIRKNKNNTLSLLLQTPSSTKLSTTESIKSEQFDLKGCIPMYGQNQLVIKDKNSYLKHMRIDAQTERCKKNAESLDFEKYNYLGLLIRSGYCRYPKGLKHKLTKDNAKKTYTLNVSYIDPENQICRALSRYEMWLKVPKLQKGFEVIFKTTSKPRSNKSFPN